MSDRISKSRHCFETYNIRNLNFGKDVFYNWGSLTFNFIACFVFFKCLLFSAVLTEYKKMHFFLHQKEGRNPVTVITQARGHRDPISLRDFDSRGFASHLRGRTLLSSVYFSKGTAMVNTECQLDCIEGCKGLFLGVSVRVLPEGSNI